MMAAIFKHFDLKLIEPSFDSMLIDLVIELDHLRKKEFKGTTPAPVFFQLKELFHTLESLCSARIEGNRTTLAEVIENRLDGASSTDEKIREIINMEEVMNFIDHNVQTFPLNQAFICELHRLTVKDLTPPPKGEGDNTPGIYRKKNVDIAGSNHKPPEYLQVNDYMDELIEFINRKDLPKYDLIKTAVAHHRFVWIHPFVNGNGRTVRLFTYALLVKQGFHVNTGRILNPTAVFCSDRKKYYDYLAEADSGENKDIELWCEYVLSGLKQEIEKIDRLTEYSFLKKEIIIPAIGHARERQIITDTEAKILRKTAELGVMQASDIGEFFPKKAAAEVSRQIARLKKRKMLQPEKEGSRKYVIRFDNNYLLRGIIKCLGEKGFLPVKD
ncbi:MAG: cell filamentation protein Fic [Chloroflexi bacterium HGW-Chloroflexi-5]|nr:MAG: cell filamentation protein Fic [Deltaproteobacteria bacterium HGW-Deltaproteobacteria-12]PKN96605.1 MAG: cell filamentation protein Fic [Chloroflexi bacterium HGW-Chloroflexi-5]